MDISMAVKYLRLFLKLTVCALFISTVCFLPAVRAATPVSDTGQKSRDWDVYCITGGDCALYGPETCDPTAEAFSSGEGSSLKGKALEKYIYDFFVSRGLTPAGAAGIMGNINAESGFDPAVFEGGADSSGYPVDGVGFGLIQWTFTSRQAPLVEMAKKAGVKPTDVDIQLQYVMRELKDSYQSVYNVLKTSNDIYETTSKFMLEYEAPLDQSAEAINGRVAGGRAYLSEYGNGSTASAGGSISGGGMDANGACCPPTPVPNEVSDGSPADWKKMYTGANKSKVNSLAHGRINPKILVIHYTVGDTEGQDLLDYFTGNGLGIQFNVGKDGQVYQYYPLTNMQETYHVGDANDKAIGIEITGRDVNDLLNNQKQFEAVSSLSKFLCDYYKIPCSDAKGDMTGDGLSTAQGMLGHDETPTNDHNDPDAKYGQTIDRSDSSKHPYMMKLRTALGFDPTPGKKGGAITAENPGTVTAASGANEGCVVGADTVSGNGTKENPVGEGVNKALALEAIQYNTATTKLPDGDNKYFYKWGGLHGSVSQLQAFSQNGGGTDCSGFIRYIIWRVYGKDVGSFVTQNLPNMADFKKVDPSDVQAGDIGWLSDHVDFITDNQGGGKLHEFGAHSEATNLHGGPATTESYDGYYRYIGPKGGGN
jgi:cell wall-associated NlpC family hydrolase